MKFSLNLEKKNASVDLDVERLVEKGMEQNDKNWKDKFDAKHKAKKEILEIKHKQKMEKEDKNQTKKNWFQKVQEEKRKLKELELAEERRKEEEHKRILKIKIIFSSVCGIIGLLMMIIGGFLGASSNDPNSSWYMLSVLGFLPLFVAGAIWIYESNDKKKKR